MCDGTPALDLDYIEDSQAEADMNLVMNDAGEFIEIPGAAEGHPFSMDKLNSMLELGRSGVSTLLEIQRQVLES